jgi:hypothetical protein
MHLFNSSRHRRGLTLALMLTLLALAVAGCGLVAGPEEGSGAATAIPDTGASPADESGTLIISAVTLPAGQAGSFTVTGVPSGTISTDGTLVVSDLEPGTYTTTQIDPAPDFDVSAVECDDGGSPTASSGDAQTRTAVLNLDPGETIRCTFTNTQRGTAVIAAQVDPEGVEGRLLFTGVPSGTIPANGTLVVTGLSPGTYTTTEADPEPDFELTDVTCDDGDSGLASSGDPSTRTAVFNVDPGETVQCLFTNEQVEPDAEPAASGGGAEGSTGSEAEAPTGINPFEDPDPAMDRFPLPEDLPPDAGTFAAPKAGPWSVVNYAGRMTCGGAMTLDIPASPPESGILEVLDGGQTVIGSGLQEDEASITMMAYPEITGRYTGAFEGTEQGVPVTINYYWQVITEEHIVGFLTASVTSEGVSCEVYRSYEMTYTG